MSSAIFMCKRRKINVQQILCVMPFAWSIHKGRILSFFQTHTHTFWMFDRSTCNIVLQNLSADIGNPRCYHVVVLDNFITNALVDKLVLILLLCFQFFSSVIKYQEMKLSIVSTVLPFMADSGENLRSTNNTQSVFPSKIYFSHVLKFILATVLSIFTFMF